MKHIFIIEDDPGILDALTFLLSEKYQISAIADARDAIERLKNEKPDLILVDLWMPVLDGAEFIKHMQEQGNSIPILVMTANSNIENKLRGLKVADVIRKPFDIEAMEAKIAYLTSVPTYAAVKDMC